MRLLESVIPVRACHVFLVLVSLYASPSAQAALIELIAVTAAVSATPILSGAVPSPILSRQRLHEAPVQGPQASRKLDCAGRRQAGPWSSMTRGCTRREEGHPNFQSHDPQGHNLPPCINIGMTERGKATRLCCCANTERDGCVVFLFQVHECEYTSRFIYYH